MRSVVLAALSIAILALSPGLRNAASALPTINTPASATPNPGIVGQNVRFDIGATGTGLTYQWDFGDGTLDPVSAVSFRDHVYVNPGHYNIAVTVTDVGPGSGPVTQQFKLVVHHPLTTVKPTNSSTIVFDAANARIWVVNPDQDTVASFSTSGAPATQELPVGRNPRTLAQAGDGTIWVVSQGHPSISILHPTSFALLHVIPLAHGSAPYGIAMTPDGSAAYVTFQGAGGVAKISTTTRAVLASNPNPPAARGVSVTHDGRVLVTRFISPQSNSLVHWNTLTFVQQNRGEVVELDAALNLVRTFALAIDPGFATVDPDFGPGDVAPSSSGSRGVPNYITSMVVTPDGRRAWVPSKKDNIQRGSRTPERDNRTPGPEITYRAIVSSIDLMNNSEQIFERQDIDNNEMPQAACTSPLGDYIFIALQGTNRIQIRDLFNMSVPLNGVGNPSGTAPLAVDGLSPQGLVLDPATNRLFCQNYMGRTVTVFDVASILNGSANNLGAPLAVIPTVTAADLLPPPVLLGKRVFYNAGDPRMSTAGYISCAGCHLDGGSDMRVWDFTNRTEGFRNTVMLQGRGGTAQGFVHWSANFDEIQDFENDIRNAFGGLGFLTNPQFAASTNPYVDTRKASFANPELDALAAYVGSLTKVARSPFRNADGTLTPAAAAGEAVFKAQNCQQCHGGPRFSNSTVPGPALPNPNPATILFNVGTLKPTSGNRLGAPLPGIDTPTLKGIWQTAPYFHDGSAATMDAVMSTVPIAPAPANAHGGMHLLSQIDRDNLARYMIEIDELDAPPVPSTQVNTFSLGVVASGRPYSLATSAQNRLPFVDRSYTITSPLPAAVNGKILLRTCEDDKGSTAASQVTLTLTAAADVYVYYDSRAGSLPPWMAGYLASAANDLTISPGLLMKAYVATFPAGTVTLGGNRQGGVTGALRSWFAIVSQAGAVFEEGPISQGEWAHEQDGDGDGLRDEYEASNIPTIPSLSPWDIDSIAVGVADEDQNNSSGVNLFDAQPALFSGAVSSSTAGGGCGLGGFEFLIPVLLFRFARRRR